MLVHGPCTNRRIEEPTLDGSIVGHLRHVGIPPRFNQATRVPSIVYFLRPWMVGERGFLVPTLPPGSYSRVLSASVTSQRTSSATASTLSQ